MKYQFTITMAAPVRASVDLSQQLAAAAAAATIPPVGQPPQQQQQQQQQRRTAEAVGQGWLSQLYVPHNGPLLCSTAAMLPARMAELRKLLPELERDAWQYHRPCFDEGAEK